MGDCIKTIKVNVEIQENGIIRLDDGRLIGRLVESFKFSMLEEEKERCTRGCNDWTPDKEKTCLRPFAGCNF